jgi:hypothetical protein
MKKLPIIPRLLMLSLVLVCISYPVTSANAKKVIIENITLNVTVIIPITVVAQNAQICISLASSGDQTCQQLILDPTQTSYTAIDVDLTQQVPVITSGSANQTGTTTSNETSTFAGNSNQTFEPGKSNITNPSGDHGSKNIGQDSSGGSSAADSQNVKEDKDTNKEQQDEPAQGDSSDSEDANEP